MTVGRWMTIALAALIGGAVTPAPAAAQETGIKVGVSVSRLQGDVADFWDGSLTATTFAGHLRFHFGPIALQPELHVVTKGGTVSAPTSERRDQEQIRLEYLEIPLLLVVPVQVGSLEPFAYAGPSLMLESRCRWVVREDGLRSTFSCDPAPAGQVFERRMFDFGAVAGGGASYPVGAGRVMLEARHTRGLRNIFSGQGDADAYNRTFTVLLGYTMGWAPSGN
jgi:hypothetical protein